MKDNGFKFETPNRWRRLPLRLKLTLCTMAVVVAALIVAGLSVIAADSVLFRATLERGLLSIAQITASNSAAALAFEDHEAATEVLARLQVRTRITAACLFRSDGTTFGSYVRPGGPVCKAPPGGNNVAFGERHLIVWWPVTVQNRQMGTFALYYDLGEFAERRRSYGLTVLGILLAAAAITFVLSFRLSKSLASPIVRLAEAAATVSRTKDYSVRVTHYWGDETASLVSAFNDMLEGIAIRERELREALGARESALASAEEAQGSLRTTLASIGEAVIATDSSGKIVFANPAALSLMKCDESYLKDKPLETVFELLDERSGLRIENVMTSVTGVLGRNLVLVACDETRIPVEVNGAPILDQAGRLGGNVLVVRDVTTRRDADATSRLLSSIVESSDDAIMSCDLNGVVTSWNQAAEHIFGYQVSEMIGMPLQILAPPGHEGELRGLIDRIEAGERIIEFKTIRRSKHGHVVHVSLTVSPLVDDHGQTIGISKIARDITEQVKAAEQLANAIDEIQQTNRHLARTNEDLERFAFIASHDLQEPLRMIATFSQLLIESRPGSGFEEERFFTRQIVESTARMRELLADLLDYAQLGASTEAPPQRVELNSVLSNVLANLSASLQETKAVVTFDRLPALMGFEGHFMALLQNLIANAIKYRSDAPPLIHVSFQNTPKRYVFAVSDNGIGIDPEFHERIFLAFKRLHGSTIPGTGIGLSICQRVVERYGGRIWVESHAGEGATFFFSFPAGVLAKDD